MFSDNFFPTPDAVIDMMLEPYANKHMVPYGKFEYETWTLPAFGQILEPSAGKGNICDRLVKKYNVDRREIFCIEQDWELQDTLRGKGYKVIDSDFLLYGDILVFDAIVMNPPFNDGASHLLKAWEVLDHGHIVCVLNAETIRNPYSEERKMLSRLIDAFSYRDTRFVENAFSDAERQTDVEIAIVWLEKPKKETAVPDFDTQRMDFDGRVEEPEFAENQLARADIIGAIVDQYNAAVIELTAIHAHERKFKFYTREVRAGDYGTKEDRKKRIEDDTKQDERRAPETLNEKIMELKAEFWKYIFEKTKLGRVTTSNFQRKFFETQNQIAQLAFTVDNIMYVLETFLFNREEIIMECIYNVFDEATRYYKDNRDYYEGWAHNDDYKMSGHIIWPGGIDYDSKHDSWRLSYSRESFYADLDKALCFLTGRSYDNERDPSFVSIVAAITMHLQAIEQRWRRHSVEFESTFFYINVYKKGTVHLKMKDPDLLARFNIVAAKGKKWVSAGKQKKQEA